MVVQIAQYTKFCSVFGIVSDNNNYVLQFYHIRLSGLLSWSSLGISGISQLISLLLKVRVNNR